jgi:hypothetical protein
MSSADRMAVVRGLLATEHQRRHAARMDDSDMAALAAEAEDGYPVLPADPEGHHGDTAHVLEWHQGRHPHLHERPTGDH